MLVIKIVFFDILSYFTEGKLIPNIAYIIAHSVNSEEISIKRTNFNTNGNTLSATFFNIDTILKDCCIVYRGIYHCIQFKNII
jgi:hypothetical protein